MAQGYSIRDHCTPHLPATQIVVVLNTLRHQKIIVRSIFHLTCFRMTTLLYGLLLVLVDRNLLVLKSQQHRLLIEGSGYQ